MARNVLFSGGPKDQVLKKSENKSGSHSKTLQKLIPFLWMQDRIDLKARILLALLLLLSARLLAVFVPYLFKSLIDALTDQQQLTSVDIVAVVPIALIFGYGVARLTGIIVNELVGAAFLKVSLNVFHQTAVSMFSKMHELSHRFHLDKKVGSLSVIIERGVRSTEAVMDFVLIRIIPSIVEILIVSALFWVTFGLSYTLVVFFTLITYAFVTIEITEWRLKFRRNMIANQNAVHEFAIDSLINFEAVKGFSNQKYERDNYKHLLNKYQSSVVKSRYSLTLLNIAQGFLTTLGLTFVVLMAAKGVAKGDLTLGDIVLINALVMQIILPLNTFGMMYRDIKHSLTDMEAMFDLIDANPEIKNATDHPVHACLKGEGISFENVCFGYGRDSANLKDVSFSVRNGQTLGIVGFSGSGKSTVSRLLMRFYDVDSGAILVDGSDVRNIDLATLRNLVGFVPQETTLFNTSIKHNIRYGCLDASDEDVELSAKRAGLHEFISGLPNGYETVVGERGQKLSGGEKQRVAIARVLLKSPKIFLFDEATSALDSITESAILDIISEYRSSRTMIIIAHRLSTVAAADEILVMDGGQIVERGTHDELQRLGGQYDQMWNVQQKQGASATAVVSHSGIRKA